MGSIKNIQAVRLSYNFLVSHFFGKNKRCGNKLDVIRNCSLVKRSTFINKGTGNRIIIENGCYLYNCSFKFYGDSNEIIIKSGAHLNGVIFHIEDNDNHISIGKGTSVEQLSKFSCIEGTSIRVGDDCMFSSEISIATGDSHSIVDSQGKRTNFSSDIIIGDHVWLGYRVIINKGVHLANNCIVGSGSIVTKSITNSNTTIAGNPARVINSRVNWIRKRI